MTIRDSNENNDFVCPCELDTLYSMQTNIAAATSMLVWTLCDTVYFGKPSCIGAVQGIITGLVVITPGAGWSQ